MMLTFVFMPHLISVHQGRLSSSANLGRAPTTVTTVRSVSLQSGTASTWRRPSLMETASGWSSSPMTRGISRKQRRAAWWCTNVRKYLENVPMPCHQSFFCFLENMHHFKQHILSCPAWHRHLSTLFLGEEYIKSLIANPELVDRLALSDDDKVSTFEPIVFTVNLPRFCIQATAFVAWIWNWICIHNCS